MNPSFKSRQHVPKNKTKIVCGIFHETVKSQEKTKYRNSRYVRVVKETDLKSVGLRPRRFEPCCRRAFFFLFFYSHIIFTPVGINDNDFGTLPFYAINMDDGSLFTDSSFLFLANLDLYCIDVLYQFE
ncbi:transmembrane protein, putative [Medicago truncatula]|uniref:Transmembrane protein, putative n=1 Tax=Medicago truncatula TaxID=3880 RepID=G7J7U6_MEDTR|nr:transmembrane protein, putative [Medicago truncatula]